MVKDAPQWKRTYLLYSEKESYAHFRTNEEACVIPKSLLAQVQMNAQIQFAKDMLRNKGYGKSIFALAMDEISESDKRCFEK